MADADTTPIYLGETFLGNVEARRDGYRAITCGGRDAGSWATPAAAARALRRHRLKHSGCGAHGQEAPPTQR